jgi:hypothetical protein
MTMDVARLADLLHETSDHHEHFEKTHQAHDWWDWYAPYLDARIRGEDSQAATRAADSRMEEIFRRAVPR